MPTSTKTIDDYIEANLVHSLHVSERKSFRGCRRRWSWVYRDLYYPQVTAKPLEFGIAFHEAMQHWFDPDTWGIDDSSRELETLLVFQRACERQKKEYIEKQYLGQEWRLDPEVEIDYKERIELGRAMLKQMFLVSYEIDQDYRPVGVEVPFEVPIPDENGEPIWCRCDRCWNKWKESPWGTEEYATWERQVGSFSDRHPGYFREVVWKGLPVTLGGRIDALFLDTNGRYWIVDWKTAARLSTGEPGAPDDYLFLDDQITSYCWALWCLKLDVAGFLYHEIKKSVTEEPEPLKRGRMGGMYSQSKSKDYDYATYLQTVMENDRLAYDRGVYDDYLEWLKHNSSGSYKRHKIHRSPAELTQAGFNLAMEALDMTDPKLRIYPNPGRFGCNTCAFRQPCLATNMGEDVQYTLDSLFEKRQRLYYEDAPPNSDKPSVG